MASYCQPEDFYVEWIAATEKPASGLEVAPANIIQAGDSLYLRTYFVWDGTNFWERDSVKAAVEGSTVSVTYYLENLVTGGNPVKIGGGPLKILTSLDSQMQKDGWTYWYYGPNDLVYRFGDTAEITTGPFGSGKTLELPTASANDGTWQVLVVLNGGLGTRVCAFSSDMFIQIVK
jgi:hypothetical protein